ncbi:MAG: M13 family metallopeptidase [Atopobiaceae bacterium]|nr:M13 family metallopeptidase [Atopobiaceae bacterium]
MRETMRRLVAVLVSVSLVLAGCAPSARGTTSKHLEPTGAPWQDWFVRSVLTADENVRLEDDFYTAANRDGILAYNADPYGASSVAMERENEIANQMAGLLAGGATGQGADHDLATLRTLYSLYTDWNARDADGVAPVDGILDHLCNIQTLDEFTAWMCSDDFRLSMAWRYLPDASYTSQGLSLIQLSPFNEVDAPLSENEAGDLVPTTDAKKAGYAVEIGAPDYTLAAFELDENEVMAGGEVDREALTKVVDACKDVEATNDLLEYLGFSKDEADRTAREAASLEAKLDKSDYEREDSDDDSSNGLSNERSGGPDDDKSDDSSNTQTAFTHDELVKKCEGGFPLDRIIDAFGYGDAASYEVDDLDWLEHLNELYVEENLDLFVSHALAGIALESATLLDTEAYNLWSGADGRRYCSEAILKAADADATDGSDEVDYTGASEEQWALWDRQDGCFYAREVAPTSFAKVYAQNFYDEKTTGEVEGMVRDYVTAYGNMLEGENWISRQTREAAAQKLRAMRIQVGHPTTWPSTDGMEVHSRDEGGTLFSETRRMAAFDLKQESELLHHPEEGAYWRDCMDANAYYDVATNTVSIGMGMLGGAYWPKGGTYEEQLAGVGTTIGHEISHAFDDSGAYFDENGAYRQWWTDSDLDAFENRVERVERYFNSLNPVGRGTYDGSAVCGEAIADMASLKATMLVAATRDGFDYDAFFRGYAHAWLGIMSVADALDQMATDTHPLESHRVNVPVREVEEFYATYGVSKGDGMWLDSADRISVW